VSDPALDPHRPALATRLLSLTGVVPLGLFLVVHLALNLRALGGELAFARAVGVAGRIPALAIVEVLFIFAPLAVHAGLGVWMTATGRPMGVRSAYPRALRVAMRVTGVLVLAFLAMHLPELRFRLPGTRPDAGQLMTFLSEDLSDMRGGLPWRGALYLLGSACTTFHFVVGLWGFFASRGAVPGEAGEAASAGERARRRAAWWAAAVGATMWMLFVAVAVYHATGARLLGGGPEAMAPAGPCPAPSAQP
jgi:succinate dehydrogenase / fumarate reductase, cytochrome b subunit